MKTLLSRILDELEVPYTTNYVDNLYNKHPYRYTLYGIQQMLSRYNIKTTTVRLKDKEDLSKIDTPFLAEAYNDIVIFAPSKNNKTWHHLRKYLYAFQCIMQPFLSRIA